MLLSYNSCIKTIAYIFICLSLCVEILPLLILLLFSFNSEQIPLPWKSFTLQNYISLVGVRDVMYALGNSILIAITSTLLSITSALTFIYMSSKISYARKTLPIFYCTFAIPETIFAIAILKYFLFINANLGFVTIVISHSVIGMSITIPVLHGYYESIDISLMEASKALGVSHLESFLRIIIPMLFPLIILTMITTFILSLDNFIISYFCGGNHINTFTIFLISSIKNGITPNINALAGCIVFITLLLSMIMANKLRKWEIQ